jgi:hypothetical protein
MALLSCLCSYRHLFNGPTNRSLRTLAAGLIPGYGARQMTYDLRRLRREGLIRRAPGSQHYELTHYGRRIAVFFTKTYTRILNPSHRSRSWTPACPTRSHNDHHSRTHGVPSGKRSTTVSPPLSSPLET